MNRTRLVLACWMAALSIPLPAPARADSALIVVAQPQPGQPDAERLVHRLKGELSADGIVPADAQAGAPVDAEALAARARAAGAPVGVQLDVSRDAHAIDLTVVDATTGRALRRRVEVDANDELTAPEVVARRCVDLLRASLLDFMAESLRSAMTRAETAKTPEPPRMLPPPGPPPARLGVQLDGGMGVLASFGGVGPALLPVVRVAVAVDRRWQLRATGAWLGTRPTLEAPQGSASIDQGVALLEIVASPWPSRALRPTGSLGAGIYGVRVTGDAAPPYTGAVSSSLAVAFSAGAGLAVRLAQSFDVRVEAQAVATSPGLAVRFLGDDVARIGRPSLLAAASLGGWL